MKRQCLKLGLLLLFASFLTPTFAQAPQKMSYQAVVRNSTNQLVTNITIGMRISILQGSMTGTPVYVETHDPTTNGNGLVTVEIGTGNPVLGTFAGIDWSGGPYFIRTETDPSGGNLYTIMGTRELLSVPFALYAASSGNVQTNIWSYGGNAGTIDGIHFIGTTDDAPFNIRVNNEKAGRISNLGANTFLGYQAGNVNEGTNNAAIGTRALYANTTGGQNTASGSMALQANTTGYNNTATGSQALHGNTSGIYNSAVGAAALYSNSTGNNNTANGAWAMWTNTTGNENSAFGSYALYSNSVGNGNLASGWEALRANTTGNGNVAVGWRALHSNTTGDGNTVSGSEALKSNTIGDNNTAVGSNAMMTNQTGMLNTAIGREALLFNTTGNDNTAAGSGALSGNTSGGGNAAVGVNALATNSTGSHNSALGYGAGPNAAGYSNATALGYLATNTASNQVRIGNGSVLSIGGAAGWSTVSDGRVKKDVSENVPGLEFVLRLRPVTYHLDMDQVALLTGRGQRERDAVAEATKAGVLQSGFIAQEVEASAAALGYDFSGVDRPQHAGDVYGLRYGEFTVPLVKAVQELHAENAALKIVILEQAASLQSLQEKASYQQSINEEVQAKLEALLKE